MQDILSGLNDKQYESAVCTSQYTRIIAGAGSGKTKVLTHKIAYMIGEKGAKPWDILAITFTNKAANEMKERIANLVGDDAKDIWMGTFHSICVRILRRFIDRIGFDSSFIIFELVVPEISVHIFPSSSIFIFLISPFSLKPFNIINSSLILF